MTTPGEWYKSLPPINRIYGTTCVAATLLVQLGLVSPAQLVLVWDKVLRKFEIWRLITNFCFLGPFGIRFIMSLLFLVQYGVYIEKFTFEGRTADFLFLMLFGMVNLLVVDFFYNVYVLSMALIFMLLYLWSRFNPNQSVSIWGLFQLQATYLPWALMGLNVLMGGSPIMDLLGIFVGHLYYFLAVLYPRSSGNVILTTPNFLHRFIAQVGLGQADPRFVAEVAEAQRRPFAGRGQRLGAD